MSAASGNDPAKTAAAFAALATARVWFAVAEGLEGGVERAVARARLAGFASLALRVGQLPDGTPFMAAATTEDRLAASGLTEPGDTVTTMPLASLARVALANGLQTLIINAGSAPMALLSGGALRSIADGLRVDAVDPDRVARVQFGQVRRREANVPDALATAITTVLSGESIEAAAISPGEINGAPVWMCLVAGPVSETLKDNLVAAALPLVGPDAYFSVRSVDAAQLSSDTSSSTRFLIDRR